MAKMGGDLDGTLAISGQSDKPMAEGYLILDTASVYVGAAGSTFRFDDKKIEIKNNRIFSTNMVFTHTTRIRLSSTEKWISTIYPA